MNPYIPQKLPIETLDYHRLLLLIGTANAELGRYDGLLRGTVNPELMLGPLTEQEAVLSSKIEGTQATVDEVLGFEAGIPAKTEREEFDFKEVINYRKALQLGRAELADCRPVTLHLIRALHKELLSGVRGEEKNPGEFRVDQNWIGPLGCTIDQAAFIPPSPLILVDRLEAWQEYLSSDDGDVLIQSALVHAQFELLHPFRDGNGRIGRMLIPLFLYQKERISQPMFYLSGYLEAHREEYYTRLRAISETNDWTGWAEFFLRAIMEQSRQNSQTVVRVMKLYDNMKEKIQSATKSQYTMKILDAIFRTPVFKASSFIETTGIVDATAQRLLRVLRDAGIITVLSRGAGRTPSVYRFDELLDVAGPRNN